MDDGVSSLRVTAHPVRLRILSLLTGTAMSAAEVARELDITHANASYHLRQLLGAGEIEEAGEEQIRGGVAKRYRYPYERAALPPTPSGPRASDDDHLAYARAISHETERRLLGRRRGVPMLVSDLEGWVPEKVWQEAFDLLSQASALLHENNTAPRSPDTVHVAFTSWIFRMEEER